MSRQAVQWPRAPEYSIVCLSNTRCRTVAPFIIVSGARGIHIAHGRSSTRIARPKADDVCATPWPQVLTLISSQRERNSKEDIPLDTQQTRNLASLDSFHHLVSSRTQLEIVILIDQIVRQIDLLQSVYTISSWRISHTYGITKIAHLVRYRWR